MHSSAFVLLLRSAQKNFPRRDNFRDSNERKSREEYDEILFWSIEDFSIAPNCQKF